MRRGIVEIYANSNGACHRIFFLSLLDWRNGKLLCVVVRAGLVDAVTTCFRPHVSVCA